MRIVSRLAITALTVWLTASARAQYIGYVYPAGGQQGTTFQVRVGGQRLDGVHGAIVSGTGVTARIVEYLRPLNNQEEQLVREQLQKLKRARKTGETASTTPMMASEMTMTMMAAADTGKQARPSTGTSEREEMIARIEKRLSERVQTPACASIATLVIVEVTIAPDAPPGERELRLVTLTGVSNPLRFHVGQVPEFTRKPMKTATLQVLGKEAQALRKRPPEEAEDHVTLPCVLNGQIASGEVNSYRFAARKGQRLAITTLARQLIPYIADAVPGWFQPVIALYDANGREVAYDDDYRFKPDPVILYEVPRDGEYVLVIRDSIYRGREDFVYRITVGEMPFITSIFPLGARVGEPVSIQMQGWNLQDAVLNPPPKDAPAGVHLIAATNRKGIISNRVPFALDTLPEHLEKEPNDTPSQAEKITLPVIINGRINKKDDWDVFQFQGKANDTVTVEVYARRLDSPLDSIIKLTDAKGNVVAFNDDNEDLASGLNTHHADSYFQVKLPADGSYYVHIGDTARQGGEEYAYRLRISAPRPGFELRVVPSYANLRSKSTATANVYVLYKDGFTGPIQLGLKNPPTGFTAAPASIGKTQAVGRITFKTDLLKTETPVNLLIEGRAKVGEEEIVREAVAAEDRMQAFLWRHLVPAQEYKVLVYDPTYQLPAKRVPPPRPANTTAAKPAPVTVAATTGKTDTNATTVASATKGKFTKQQIAGRVRELKRLYEEGLITDEFYDEKMTECEAAQ